MYAVLSAVFASLVAIFGKIGLKDVDSTLATTVRAVVMAVFLVAVSLSFSKFSLLETLSGKAFAFIALSGIAGAISWLFYFLALKTGPTSVVAAIDKTSIVLVFVLAVLFLGESFTWVKAIGATLVGAGALLMVL
jgi:transporter family protein